MSNEPAGLNTPKHGSGGGEDDYDYHIGKGQKILLCAIAGMAILTVYYYIQIQIDLKTTDWTLNPNTNWTCSNLSTYEKAMEISTSEGHFEFPKQLAKNIQDKRLELGCP